MLFTELRYLLFFGLVFAVHWLLRSNALRKRWLLLGSYVFYAGWDWRFCGLILLSTIVDFHAGRRLGAATTLGRKRAWLAFSLAVNLGLLGFFKYFNFFVESGAGLFHLFGWDYPLRTLEIVLPVGISFYTFQTLSYTIDIYRRALKPVDDFLDFALFVGFFPQLVAGPIVRAVDFLPQLGRPRRFGAIDFRACLTLFLIGFVKKACIADNLAPVVDEYFADPGRFDAASAWIAILYYSVQFYCDFSGYSDMAIASAGLLGYRLRLNFYFPYFSLDIQDFWRRWHMSLSHWCRDYLFFSLMKVWRKKQHVYLNIAVTMITIGFWHGAGWNFIAFGALHAAAMMVHIPWSRGPSRKRAVAAVMRWIGAPLTYFYCCATLIVFRLGELEPTGAALEGFLLGRSPGPERLQTQFALLYPGFVAVHWIAYKGWLSEPWKRLPAPVAHFLLGAGAALALQWAAKDYQPFLYFQF